MLDITSVFKVMYFYFHNDLLRNYSKPVQETTKTP